MATDSQVLSFLSDPNLTDEDVANKMLEAGVTPTQVARVTGLSEEEINSRFNTVMPDADPYAVVKNAMSSAKLTQGQYDALAGYFGNENLAYDKNQQKDFVNNKTGYEFANYAATRDAKQGGGNREQQIKLLGKLSEPFLGTTVNYGVEDVSDSETGQVTGQNVYITDPITGNKQNLELVDPKTNTYRARYGELGRAASDPGKTGYFPMVYYQLDDKGNAQIVGGGPELQKVSVGYADFWKAAGLMTALAFGAPYLTEAIGAGTTATGAGTAGAVGAAEVIPVAQSSLLATPLTAADLGASSLLSTSVPAGTSVYASTIPGLTMAGPGSQAALLAEQTAAFGVPGLTSTGAAASTAAGISPEVAAAWNAADKLYGPLQTAREVKSGIDAVRSVNSLLNPTDQQQQAAQQTPTFQQQLMNNYISAGLLPVAEQYRRGLLV
jgi:hypothetical protein